MGKNLPNDPQSKLREIIYSPAHKNSPKVAQLGLSGDFFMELAEPKSRTRSSFHPEAS
jgi:hypothetical protein